MYSKKQYSSPKLEVYGTISQKTFKKSGTTGDGSGRRTVPG